MPDLARNMRSAPARADCNWRDCKYLTGDGTTAGLIMLSERLFLETSKRVPEGWTALVWQNLLVAIAYVLSGYAGLELAIVGRTVTLFWAPSGIAVAMVWLRGPRLLPGVATGALVVNLLTISSPAAAIVVALGNTLPSLAVRVGLLRIIERRSTVAALGELERVTLFVAFAGLLCTTISACFGTFALDVIALDRAPSFETWFIWWMGDAAGVIAVAPPILLWRRIVSARLNVWRLAEAGALAIAIFGVVASFRVIVSPIWAVEVCKLVCLLIGMVAAVRFGLTGAVLATVCIAIGTIVVTVSGYGPFLRGGLTSSYALLHSFLLIEAVASALLAAALADLRRSLAQSTAARQIALDADLAKSKLLAAASHDLRQPIHALKLSLDVLAQSFVPPSNQKVLDHARAAANASAEMLDTLLDFSRTEVGVIRPRTRSFELQPILNGLEAELAPQADLKRLIYRTRETDVSVIADPALVELILRNLIGNALRYTPSGGILVGCRLRSDHVVIEVRDTGIGIPEHEQASIFNEFYQSPQSRSVDNKGLGLGLAIASRIAQDLDTTITVRSSPGKGSVFSFRLPRASPATQEAANTDMLR
jgi:signal transduction histidine kinase